MKIDWSFPRQVLVTLMLVAGASAYPLIKFGSPEIVQAAIAGATLATMNVLAGYAAVEYSFGKSTTTFFKYVLGGMGVRMFVLALLLAILIKAFEFHTAALVGSLGILYAIYLALEVLFIQKKVNLKHQ